MNFKEIKIKIGIFLGILILFSGMVSAFSVSAPNIENDILFLYPGAEVDLKFVLQDSGESFDITAKADILQGSEIIKLVDRKNIYTISPGEKIPVNYRIKIPETAVIGQEWSVVLSFSKAGSSGTGLSFGSTIDQIFKVTAGEKPPILPEEPKKSLTWFYVLIGVGILVAIFFIKLKRKKRF